MTRLASCNKTCIMRLAYYEKTCTQPLEEQQEQRLENSVAKGGDALVMRTSGGEGGVTKEL